MPPFRLLLAGLLAALPLLAGCGGDTEQVTPADAPPAESAPAENTIVSVAKEAGLTTFRTLLSQAGLEDTLAAGGPFTVFAPSDEAFNALPEGRLEELLAVENRDEVRGLVGYHTIARRIHAADLSGQMSLPTLQGQSLTLTAGDGPFTVTDGEGHTAAIFLPDLEASNGVIHVIDVVLVPGEAAPADTAAVR